MNFLKNIFNKSTTILENYTPNILKKYKEPLLSGVFLGASCVPFPMFFMFFALVPLWLFIYKQTKIKEVLIGSWLTQFVATLIGFNWIIYTAHTFGQLNWLFSFISLILFCALANLFITIASVAWFLIAKNKKHSYFLKLLLLPISFSLFHTIIPAIFPWNMGDPWLWASLPAAQTAELWGFRFFNTIFYIFNLLFLILYKHRLDRIGKTTLATIITLFLFLNVLGLYLKKRLPDTDSFLKAIVIQHNIGSVSHLKYKKPFKDPRDKSLYQIKNLIVKSFFKYYKKNKDINFFLLSEGAYPYIIDKRKNKLSGISSLVKRMKIPMIIGGMSRDHNNYSNSLVVLDRKGKIMKPIYDKVNLLAFGEQVPGSQTFPFLLKLLPYFNSNLKPGKKHQVKNLEGVLLGFQICYESVFDKFSRKLALDGSQILINITNDSWYGHWQEPWQHLILTFSRAIETRRPLIRATNTGISSVIHSDGTIQQISPINKSWYFLYQIPYYKNPPKTLFMSWGFYINEIFLFLLSLFMLTFEFLSKKRKASLAK